MRPLCGIVRGIKKDYIVVKIKSGQTHTVKTKRKFELRQKVVLLFDYTSLEVKDVVALSKLEDLRDQIDEIDDEIIKTLALRMDVVRKIGENKKQNNVTILQPERWNEILKTRTISGVGRELTEEFLLRLYNLIHEESIHQQTKMMNKKTNKLKSSE